MQTLPITLTIAAAAALINIWLGARVSHLRRLNRVLIGDGGNQQVAARMRAHANFIEYTPIFLVLLAAIELSRGSETWLWGVAIAYVLARLAHPFGMDRAAPNLPRMGGTIVTWVALLALSIYALTIPYFDRGAAASGASYASKA